VLFVYPIEAITVSLTLQDIQSSLLILVFGLHLLKVHKQSQAFEVVLIELVQNEF